MTHPQALLVLGMHRSGTSALIRTLNLLGVFIGHSHLPPHPTNEKGFWELIPLVQQHDALLHHLNSNWHSLQPLPSEWTQLKTLRPFQNNLRDYLRTHLSTHPIWGVKDPRLCRLLPLWQPLFPQLPALPHYLHLLRSPYEVAASLQKRDQLPLNHSLTLWLIYTLEAEFYTRQQPRCFLSFEQLLTDWTLPIHQIQTQFTLHWPRPWSLAYPEINQFLTPHLRHHKLQVSPQSSPLSAICQQVYTTLLTYDPNLPDTQIQLDELRTQLYPKLKTPHSAQRSQFHDCHAAFKPPYLFHLFCNPHLPCTRSQLQTTLASLQAQTHVHWQFTLLEPPPHQPTDSKFSNASLTRDSSREQLSSDPRVNYTAVPLQATDPQILSQLISQNSSGDWIGILNPGDTLDPRCLELCQHYIQTKPDWRLLYLDEPWGSPPHTVQFKPDFTLDLLRSTPYIGNFTLIQRATWQQLGSSIAYPQFYSYDLCFKVWEQQGATAIGHLPHPLYQASLENPHPDPQVAQQILEDHLQRQQLNAVVYQTEIPLVHCVEYPLVTQPMVSILIATRNEAATLQRCLHTILTLTDYPNYQIFVIDNTSPNHRSDSSYLIQIQPLLQNPKVHYQSHSQPCHLGELYRQTIAHTTGEFLLFLNDDTEIIQPDWLTILVSLIQRTEVGIVAPKILNSQHQLSHSGYILGRGKFGIAGHSQLQLPHDHPGYLNRAQTTQNYSAVSENCLLIKTDVYLNIGGFDPQLPLFGEIDLCLKVQQQGKLIVWTPFVTLLQHGMGSLTRHSPLSYQLFDEVSQMYNRWLFQLSHDPAYHPNLTLTGPPWQPETEFPNPPIPYIQDKPHVVAFPFDHWGSGQYRVRAPLQALQQAGHVHYSLFPNDSHPHFPSLPQLARVSPDKLLIHNALHSHQLQNFKYYPQLKNCSIFFSQDDLLYALPAENPHRRHHYRDILQRLKLALAYSDRLIVSTPFLAEIYQYLAKDIWVVPNCLESQRWTSLRSQRHQAPKPRIGWAGAAQHQGDLQLLIPIVQKLSAVVEWVFFGMCPLEMRPYIAEFHPMVPFADYPAKLASLNLDLALAPLADNLFNRAKSNLRLLEYGVLGIPVICSDCEPYHSAPVTRVPNNTQAWLSAIYSHLADPVASQQAGHQLRDWVLAHYLLEDHLELWQQALDLPTHAQTSPKLCRWDQISMEGTGKNFECEVPENNWIFVLGYDHESTYWLNQLLKFSLKLENGEWEKESELERKSFFEERWLFQTAPISPNATIAPLWTEYPSPFNTHHARLLKKRLLTSVIQSDIIPSNWQIYRAAVNMGRTLALQTQFPKAQFVYLKRDLETTALTLQARIQADYGSQPRLLMRIAQHWQKSTNLLLQAQSQLNHLQIVEYGDLLQKPMEVIQQLRAAFFKPQDRELSPSQYRCLDEVWVEERKKADSITLTQRYLLQHGIHTL